MAISLPTWESGSTLECKCLLPCHIPCHFLNPSEGVWRQPVMLSKLPDTEMLRTWNTNNSLPQYCPRSWNNKNGFSPLFCRKEINYLYIFLSPLQALLCFPFLLCERERAEKASSSHFSSWKTCSSELRGLGRQESCKWGNGPSQAPQCHVL